ncbi:hypothetical protein GA0115242_116218 [Streptomyces sp. SolWspMP-5a-2]|nr:hypothetical protein GA0115242_116218 [Streptomyces sp. SolWspMP-5a-2]
MVTVEFSRDARGPWGAGPAGAGPAPHGPRARPWGREEDATAGRDRRVQVRRLRSSESRATAVTTMTPLAMSCQCWLMLRL